MILCAGISLYCIGYLSKMKRKQYSIFRLMALWALIITTFEFLTGILVNIVLDLKVWNYENQPFHILGQICLPYSLLWFFLALVSILLQDYSGYLLFHQEKPSYRINSFLINALYHLSKIFWFLVFFLSEILYNVFWQRQSRSGYDNTFTQRKTEEQ